MCSRTFMPCQKLLPCWYILAQSVRVGMVTSQGKRLGSKLAHGVYASLWWLCDSNSFFWFVDDRQKMWERWNWWSSLIRTKKSSHVSTPHLSHDVHGIRGSGMCTHLVKPKSDGKEEATGYLSYIWPLPSEHGERTRPLPKMYTVCRWTQYLRLL